MTSILGALAGSAAAADWPTYRHDNARSGVSAETLPLPLVSLWTKEPLAPLQPAWPDPQPRGRRPEAPKFDFDDAIQVAMAAGLVYFGSPMDNSVRALDAATGATRWTFFTDGPVWFAPSVADGRVYFGSDDGFAYCLDAADGRLLWHKRLLQGTTRILGAGRLMSLWPVRTGVAVDSGVAYCGAGLFPANGAAVFALDAATGRTLWQAAPPPKSNASQPLSPQGYLLLSSDRLLVPCGRGRPQLFARADGRWGPAIAPGVDLAHDKGGTYGVLNSDRFIVGTQNVLYAYGPDGKLAAKLPDTRQLLAGGGRQFRLSRPLPPPNPAFKPGLDAPPAGVTATAAADSRKLWAMSRPGLRTQILAGTHLILGGTDEVLILDAATGSELWRAGIAGKADGLAVAGGRLVVSTADGRLHCFGRGGAAIAKVAPDLSVVPAVTKDPRSTALAELMARDSGLHHGYGLVIGGDPAAVALALALAERTGLRIHVAEADPFLAGAARTMLAAAGAYGTKVVVDLVAGTDLATLPYPPYFANLIVCTAPATALSPAARVQELLRLLKPCGGILYAESRTPAAAPPPAWLQAGNIISPIPGLPVTWTKLVRGRLPGATDWTHQHADTGNTGSSDDELVRGTQEVLWFGEPGPDKMQETHLRSPAPLILDGRVFVQGHRAADNQPLLLSFDAYNGVPYWERAMPGAERLNVIADCGNLAVSAAGLFVVTGAVCQRLDPRTGATMATYPLPAGAGSWAYVAAVGNTLVGSRGGGDQFSTAVFAYDLASGRLKWQYPAGAVRNSTIAAHGGRVFFVEERGQAGVPLTFNQPARARAEQAKRRGLAPPAGADAAAPYIRTVVALDLDSGRQAWAEDVDLHDCGDWFTELALIAKQEVLLMCGIYGWVPGSGARDRRRFLALAAADGRTLWEQNTASVIRPVVAGRRILGRPQSYDLLSGTPLLRPDGRGGQLPWLGFAQVRCGEMSASAGLVCFRSGDTCMQDVETGKTALRFLGMRPGCLVNIIPAGGVVVQVEASSGCACYHPLQATVVFVPVAE